MARWTPAVVAATPSWSLAGALMSSAGDVAALLVLGNPGGLIAPSAVVRPGIVARVVVTIRREICTRS